MTGRGRRKVFLIDDYPLMREGLALIINNESDLVVCGGEGNAHPVVEAILRAEPDIVIVEISLDERDPFELIKAITLRFPDLPVLGISGEKVAICAEMAMRAGAKGYVLKQDSSAEFVSAIRNVLNGRIYVSERISAPVMERYARVLSGVMKTGVDSLSSRELLVFELTGRGRTTQEIAERLFLSSKTIETYRSRIRVKLSLRNSSELLQHAIQWVNAARR